MAESVTSEMTATDGPSFREKLEKAKSGNTIRLTKGEFIGPFQLNANNVSIIGEERETVLKNSDGIGLQISGNGCKVYKLAIMIVDEESGPRVKGDQATPKIGILLTGCRNRIQDVAITGDGDRGRGIKIAETANHNKLFGINISKASYGIIIEGCFTRLYKIKLEKLAYMGIRVKPNSDENVLINISGVNVKTGICVDGSNNVIEDVSLTNDMEKKGYEAVSLTKKGERNMMRNLQCIGYPRSKENQGLVVDSPGSKIKNSVCANVFINANRVKLVDVDCGERVEVAKKAEGVKLNYCKSDLFIGNLERVAQIKCKFRNLPETLEGALERLQIADQPSDLPLSSRDEPTSINFRNSEYIECKNVKPWNKVLGFPSFKAEINQNIRIPWTKFVVKGRSFRQLTDKKTNNLFISEETFPTFFIPSGYRNVPAVLFLYSGFGGTEQKTVALSQVIEQLCNLMKEDRPDLSFLGVPITYQLVVGIDLTFLDYLIEHNFESDIVIHDPIFKVDLCMLSPEGVPLDKKKGLYEENENHFKKFAKLRESHNNCGKDDPVRVAILDTGLDPALSVLFEDIKDMRKFDYSTFKMESVRREDDSYIKHGSCVAWVLKKTCCSCTNITIYKSLNKKDEYYHREHLAILQNAIDENFHFLNLSYSIKLDLDGFDKDVCDELYQKLAEFSLPVAAAGNDYVELQYPAQLKQVISVGSLNFSGAWSSFSAGKCNADIATVGEDVIFEFGKDEKIDSGTSFATPAVIGLLTMLRCNSRVFRNAREAAEYLQGAAGSVPCPATTHLPNCDKKNLQCSLK